MMMWNNILYAGVSPNPWSKFIQFVFKIFKFFVMTMIVFFFIYSRLDYLNTETKQKKKPRFFFMSLRWIDVQYVKSFAQGCSWGNTAFSLITLIYFLHDSQQPCKHNLFFDEPIHCLYSSILKVTNLLLFYLFTLCPLSILQVLSYCILWHIFWIVFVPTILVFLLLFIFKCVHFMQIKRQTLFY